MTLVERALIPTSVECLTSHRAMLGEGPIWDWRRDRLIWVDILGGDTLVLQGAKGVFEAVRPKSPLTSIGLAAEGGYVATTYRSFCMLDEDLGIASSLPDTEPDLPGNRFNDGKVDPLGRFWSGTMDCDIVRVSGALYRFDGGDVRRLDDGYGITNGPAFSLDGRIAYHTDTAIGKIYAFDLDNQGEIITKRQFIVLPEGVGKPDGMTIDRAGRLYVAHFGGARISRWLADGSYDGRIDLPARNVTSLCFGGPAFDTIFATTASIEDAGNPLAGAAFRIRLDAIGRREPLFIASPGRD